MSGALLDPNLNALWCRAIAEELARGGVAACVLCPGSRNSPLLFALAAQPRLRCISHVDERSGAFMALGLAKASGRPAAICVTSGSALANLLPALAEAHAAGVPLIAIAADRPWELLGNGAPQAMPQRGVFGAFLAAELDLGEPTADERALRALRAQVSRLAQTTGGPSLLDVPLRDPLPPLPDPAWRAPTLSAEAADGRGDDRPYTLVAAGAGVPSDRGWLGPGLHAVDWLKPGLRGVIVAGPCAGGYPPLVAQLAAETGFPLIADAPSNLRWDECPHLVSTADALVAASGPLADAQPELVIQVGPAPLSRQLYEWLARQRCPWLCLEDGGNRDFLARAWAAIPRPGAEAYAHIAAACRGGDRAWRERWLAADARARERLLAHLATEPWGEVLAAHRACAHPGFFFVHLASSMAVRHGNLHCLPGARVRLVHANRGLNGIDGTLGTFLGECLHLGGSGMLLCGDLAFLHDLPALAAVRASADPAWSVSGAIVVLNNGGGGIFDFLPVAQVPAYERWVRTPQDHDLAAAAAQFGLAFRRVGTSGALDAALDAAAAGPGLTVIECLVPGGCADRHRALLQAMGT